MNTTYDHDLDPPDLDEDGWSLEPDPEAHYQRARPGAFGPNRRDYDQDDEDYGPPVQARRSPEARVMVPVLLFIGGGAALVWLFAGPVVVAAAAGVGSVAYVGKKVVSRRRQRRRDGQGRAGRRERRAGRQPGAGRGRGKGAAALGRSSLLGGGGLGGRGRRGGGPGGGGGGGGRGPKPGPRGPKPGASPKKGGGLLGRLGKRGAGAGAGATGGAKSGGLPGAKGKKAGRHAASGRSGGRGQGGGPRSLSRLLPGAKGRAARAAATAAKTQRHTAKKNARQAKQGNREHRAQSGGFVHKRAQARHARHERRNLRRDNRQQRRTSRRAQKAARAANPGRVRRVTRVNVARFGAGAGAIARHTTWTPLRYTGRGVRRVLRSRVMGNFGAWMDLYVAERINRSMASWARTRWANHHRNARWRRIYRWGPARAAVAGAGPSAWAWLTRFRQQQWFRQLGKASRNRGWWAVPFAALLVAAVQLIKGWRKAREKWFRGPAAVDPWDQINNPQPAAQPAAANIPDPASTPSGDPWATPPAGWKPAEPAVPVPVGYGPATIEGEDVPRLTMPTDQGHSVGGMTVPGGMHPVFAALAADAMNLEGAFDPRSFPDLTIFLNSLPEKLLQERGYWQLVGDTLAATFPGFNLAQEFAVQVGVAYTEAATMASNIFERYAVLHRADFARFLQPRVNEQYADVQRWSEQVVEMPQLKDGSYMHGSHNLWLLSVSSNLAGYHPAEQTNNTDYVVDLQWFLGSLSPFFSARAGYALNFVSTIANSFPIAPGVAEVTQLQARSFCDLADIGAALAEGYQNRNPHDTARRQAPRPNEARRDAGNREMTNSGH